ncbi:Di-copper centre-containing protein [Neolentinus lepideus HHB14362 ss-1]|uniref:tyrosinase n=1 Tax=Neolentinus lepideus HHB14362 ss-1 TaxID=1314782 RepID=A0A165Q1X9_9AGAM|nr:Di-copper centre-containing protein [Neolentinus lepideus HHB14362 ss-1]
MAYLLVQGRLDEDVSTKCAVNDTKTVPQAASFMELSGIHGLPYQEWRGDQRQSSGRKTDYNTKDGKDTGPVPSRFGGQFLGEVVDYIANKFAKQYPNESNTWTGAARSFRFPFWDWAEEKVQTEGVPPVLTDPKVNITLPEGEFKQVANPLAYDEFAFIPDGFENITYPGDDGKQVTAYFAEWKRTYRYASSKVNPGDSDVLAFNDTIKTRAKAIRAKVADLFTFDGKCNPSRAWDEFSNHSTQSLREMDFRNLASLEGIHDSLHDFIGGNGHMSFPDYAGFDPIFFLHHSNVDRRLALWEYAYTDYFVGDSGYEHDDNLYQFTQSHGTYNAVYNSLLNRSTEMAPFRAKDGEYRTPSNTRFLDSNAKMDKYYRHVIAIVETLEFAHNGPYRVELHYQDGSYIDSVSVFSRPDHWLHDERDSGSTIRGILYIPTEIIVEIAATFGNDQSNVSLDALMTKLRDSLHATIVNGAGKRIGAIGLPGSNRGTGVLAKFTTPEITLVSGAASEAYDGDFKWFGWQDHGPLFGRDRQWSTDGVPRA